MTDSERISQLEDDIFELRAKLEFLLHHFDLSAEDLRKYYRSSTIPAPPPSEER